MIKKGIKYSIQSKKVSKLSKGKNEHLNRSFNRIQFRKHLSKKGIKSNNRSFAARKTSGKSNLKATRKGKEASNSDDSLEVGSKDYCFDVIDPHSSCEISETHDNI